jgi:hypothetical protein
MIIHQSPGVNRTFALIQGQADSIEKPGFIFVVSKYFCLVEPPYHDVVQGTGDVQSGLTWHWAILATSENSLTFQAESTV